MPGPIGPAVPKITGNCQSIASDGSVSIGSATTGTVAISPKNHDRECPSSVIVDWTLNPEAARPQPPPQGYPTNYWQAPVELIVHDARTTSYNGPVLWLDTAIKKVCDDYKQSQKIYRRAEGETTWTLVAEGTSTSLLYENKCQVTRPNSKYRAAPAANQKVYFRTVDTFPNGPSGSASARFGHDRGSNETD